MSAHLGLMIGVDPPYRAAVAKQPGRSTVLVSPTRLGTLSLPLVIAGILPLSGSLSAQEIDLPPKAVPLVQRGIATLRSSTSIISAPLGESALAALAIYKSGAPADDPAIQAVLRRLDNDHFRNGVYYPEGGFHGIYASGVYAILLSNVAPKERLPQIQTIVNFLLAIQKANGSWDYPERTTGDMSVTQYVILGLWEAQTAGAKVPPAAFDRCASWIVSVQYPSGAWNYKPGESQWPPTVSMTAAGVGSLLICRDMLQPLRKPEQGDPTLISPHLIPLDTTARRERYTVRTPASAIEEAIRKGSQWIGANFIPNQNDKSPYYAMYGIERVAALLDSELIGGKPWYDTGFEFIQSRGGAGSWNSEYGVTCNTAWAVMFLSKATVISAAKARRALGAGTLIGGRGLPRNLDGMTISQGRIAARAMSGAVEGMIAVLEDPTALNAEEAVAGLVRQYQTGGPEILRPFKDRLRRLLRDDPDPGIRNVAAWALSRTEDLDVVPALIQALNDEDNEVILQARDGLRLLSRKLEGFGPPDISTPEERADAAAKWTQWYRQVRPSRVSGR